MFNSNNNLNTIPWILKDEHLVHKKNYSIHNQCFKRGYRITKEIDGTLQGIVYEAINIKNNEKVIIKCTNCALHKQNATIHNGKLVKIKENVIIEQQILKRLEAKQPPKGFVRILEIFCDGVYIFTVQEYGGKNLFDYIINCHNKIKKGILPLDEWKKHCNVLIYQCLQFIYWLHNIAKCAHLDISLENMLIKDVEYDINSKKFINHGHINFIDFGLALFLSKNKILCHKFVGKTGYKSKEIYDHKPFDPRKSDLWSIGVCLFMILTGSPPFLKPSLNDLYFANIWNGYLRRVITLWKLNDKVSDLASDLLSNIFVEESLRYDINKIMKHEFIVNMAKSQDV